MNGRFQRVMLTGEGHYCQRPGQTFPEAFRLYCREAKRIGITHIQVNQLADPYHPILLEQPNNYYAWFANYGASLDQFVSSDLNRGLYLEAYLARNRQRLIAMTRTAREEGLQPVLMLCEPRFVPERFFQKHPHLRGPRVDNPAFSTTPWYALCTDLPIVREHYRQMLRSLLTKVPEISGISIFTHDSGSGFCHSQSLYAGAHGPRICKGTNTGRRIADFLNLLQETGSSVQPDFFVSLCTSVDGQERLDFLTAANSGVSGDVQGRFSWVGGLEDQWAAHQYGSKILEVGYDLARQERIEDFRNRISQVRNCGKPVTAVCAMPTDQFFSPLKYVPHPFQNLEILQQLYDLGADHLHVKGDLTPREFLRFDINRESFIAGLQNSDASADDLVRSIAMQWVGPALSEVLINTWQAVDTALRHRPLWCWSFARESSLMPGPLVPAPDALTITDQNYFWNTGLADMDSIPGRHRLAALCIPEAERIWMLNTYETQTLPLLADAVERLQQTTKRCEDRNARACLIEQADHIHHFLLWQRSAYNWCEAGAYLAPGEGTASPRRSLPAIIDEEIAVTNDLIALLRGREHFFLELGPVEGLLYDKSPYFLHQLEARVNVMQAHRNDTVVPIKRIVP